MNNNTDIYCYNVTPAPQSLPQSLDAAYERVAIVEGLVTDPVFPENKEYLKWIQSKSSKN